MVGEDIEVEVEVEVADGSDVYESSQVEVMIILYSLAKSEEVMVFTCDFEWKVCIPATLS